ncbi:MAG: bifunctional transcriptional activator/DNA repair enzyme AdaA [Phycisphaerae bacterium]
MMTPIAHDPRSYDKGRLTPGAMYAAVRRRDASLAGAFLVGVKTTGVFCRPGCPARVPQRRNCEFYQSTREALLRGFRPCMRCRPLDPPNSAPRWARRLLEILIGEPMRVLTSDDIRRVGVHPSTASRFFKDRLGATLQGLSRAQRVGQALLALRDGAAVTSAVGSGGFDSESGLRKAVEELFGTTPGEAARRGLTPLVARWLSTPLGSMLAIACDEGLALLEFVDRRMLATNIVRVRSRLGRPVVAGDHTVIRQVEHELAEYFDGKRSEFETPLVTCGTPFQERVWRELRAIGYGETRSYAQVAAAIGQRSAVRAVAAANGDNRIAILIPCHRVIGSNGQLTGYGGGLWRKQRLLDLECGQVARE